MWWSVWWSVRWSVGLCRCRIRVPDAEYSKVQLHLSDPRYVIFPTTFNHAKGHVDRHVESVCFDEFKSTPLFAECVPLCGDAAVTEAPTTPSTGGGVAEDLFAEEEDLFEQGLNALSVRRRSVSATESGPSAIPFSSSPGSLSMGAPRTGGTASGTAPGTTGGIRRADSNESLSADTGSVSSSGLDAFTPGGEWRTALIEAHKTTDDKKSFTLYTIQVREDDDAAVERSCVGVSVCVCMGA